jgi:hypothetical protein
MLLAWILTPVRSRGKMCNGLRLFHVLTVLGTGSTLIQLTRTSTETISSQAVIPALSTRSLKTTDMSFGGLVDAAARTSRWKRAWSFIGNTMHESVTKT